MIAVSSVRLEGYNTRRCARENVLDKECARSIIHTNYRRKSYFFNRLYCYLFHIPINQAAISPQSFGQGGFNLRGNDDAAPTTQGTRRPTFVVFTRGRRPRPVLIWSRILPSMARTRTEREVRLFGSRFIHLVLSTS